jgi:hypothetical protein
LSSEGLPLTLRQIIFWSFTRGSSIFKEYFRRFPPKPEAFYLNKTVLVKGKIEEYKGRLEIILESQKQIPGT